MKHRIDVTPERFEELVQAAKSPQIKIVGDRAYLRIGCLEYVRPVVRQSGATA